MVGAASGLAANPPPAYVPRSIETGFSTVEQKYVYAPPDEGSFEMDLRVGALPREYAIEEPSLCSDDAKMHIKITYSKRRNKVKFEAEFRGLPYRPSYCYEYNPTTEFNEYPDCVEDGNYQFWVIGKMFTEETIYWYDAITLDLVGQEWAFPDGPPPGAFPVVVPGVMMMGSPQFEPKPNGNGKFTWEYAYDQMTDDTGTAGVAAGFVPKNLCFPDEYIGVYSNGGLPLSHAMSFDDILHSIHSGNGFAMATSLEPQVKPDYLRARDNIMIPQIGFYPGNIPQGYTFNMLSQTVELKEGCESHQNPTWPGPYYDLCSVN